VRGSHTAREELLSFPTDMPSALGRAPVAPVLAAPTVRAEQVTQLVLGETASIVERTGEWRRVCTHADGYHGWIHTGYLLEVDERAAEDWRSRASGWSEGASVRVGQVNMLLPLRARVMLEDGAVVMPDGRRGRVSEGTIRQVSEVRADARSKAPERWALEHFLGSPYMWGGVTPWGVDCSGLVQTTYTARGISLPRDSAQQAGCGENISLELILPGDLLFFTGESGNGITHVAFAGEADTLVHSTLSCGGVLIESWLPGTRAASLRERLVAARRLEDR
jgi:gamma-D-glutamyl-L-lysine dipeptidyl-peptidase